MTVTWPYLISVPDFHSARRLSPIRMRAASRHNRSLHLSIAPLKPCLYEILHLTVYRTAHREAPETLAKVRLILTLDNDASEDDVP